jgi:proteasome lid subunit RPN8/RPN11
LIAALVVAIVFQSHPNMQADSSKLKTYFTIGIGFSITFVFIVCMPWSELLELAELRNAEIIVNQQANDI